MMDGSISWFRLRSIVFPLTVAIALGIALGATSSHYIDVRVVRGTSMAPTLRSGATLITTPVAAQAIERKDIIVFRLKNTLPKDRTRRVKRVIGLPDDTVEMRRGQVYVNGSALEEPYVNETSADLESTAPPASWHFSYVPNASHDYQPTGSDWGPIHVPQDRIFVLGDNRDASGDSRRLGFIPHKHVTGRVISCIQAISRSSQTFTRSYFLPKL